MATMKDIARLAQVSTSTVSHVLNNSRYVSDEIRKKILDIVAELNYTPSALARSLKMKETKTIGMLVTATNNPFFAEVVSGVEHYCNQNNYNLILCNNNGNEERLNHNLQTLIQKQIDGLLLMCGDARFKESTTMNLIIPTVIMDWWPSVEKADKIFENAEYGGYLATKALINSGHQRIGIITGNLKKSLAQNRLKGYKQALIESQIALNPQWIIESHFDFEGGVQGMEKLLQLEHRPSAVFACSDAIAVGAYQTAWRYGITIPNEMSIIGYDDILLAQFLTPPLTTIHQPKADLGKLAVETLLERIKNPERDYRTLMLEPRLILRESIRVVCNNITDPFVP